jgi:voltage-gated potassium channel
MPIQQRVHEILDVAAPGDRAARAFQFAILSVIALTAAVLVLETVQSVYQRAVGFFHIFDIASVAIFTIEYVLRLWSCTAEPGYEAPVWGRLRYALRPMTLIDLFAVVPSFLPFLGVDLRFARTTRLARFFRIAKLGRYSQALRHLGQVVRHRKEELLTALFVLFLMILFAASLMYYAENDAQPEQFSSIPATAWWAVVTLTTVGYGDIYPVTALGKILASAIAILGIAMFALPTAILGAGFVESMQARRKKPTTCPHCGKEIPR